VPPDDIAKIAGSVIEILSGTHACPSIYKPAELRSSVEDAFGQRRFTSSLRKHLQRFGSAQSESALQPSLQMRTH
jgi:hypothetical protein